MGNLIRTLELDNNHVDNNNPCKGILSASEFSICCKFHMIRENLINA